MKHGLIIAVFIFCAAALHAGDISNTVFIDTTIGLASGAAIGALTALGPYSSGKNPAVFGAGCGLGTMIGGFCGLGAGIGHAVYNASAKKPMMKSEFDLEIKPLCSGLMIQTNF